jgi:PIN domain nuclease of toxin-antitoxin system
LTTVLLDTHVLYWWSTESRRLSEPAARLIEDADELAVAAMSWYELAWLMHRGRLGASLPIRPWLEELAAQVRTAGTTPTIAATAVSLPAPFTGDPADRLIYATAIEYGWPLVTKDRRMREHGDARGVTVW